MCARLESLGGFVETKKNEILMSSANLTMLQLTSQLYLLEGKHEDLRRAPDQHNVVSMNLELD